MKNIITSKSCFYMDLQSFCETIGRKCLNGVKQNVDKISWHLLYNKIDEKIRFKISYSEPSPEHTDIILTLCFESGKRKDIIIRVDHITKIFDNGYELQTVEYSIDNVFYSTIYLNGECKTEKKMFF